MKNALLNDCRGWEATTLGSASGSSTYDSCNLTTLSMTELGHLSSLASDNYYLLYSQLCGDGEIIAQLSAAPSANGFAGLEIRENTDNDAVKMGLMTRVGAQVQSLIWSASGQNPLTFHLRLG